MESRPWARTALCGVVWLTCASVLGAARDDSVRLWTGGALEYELDSAALVYAAAAPARQAGWRLRARLGLRPLACAPDEALLQLEVRSPRLELVGGARGRQLGPSPWDSPAARAPFYVHWRAGRVLAALLPAGEPPALLDYKRALAALLQFQIVDGERNETDSSGECSVLYETLSPLEFRKLKRACVWAGAGEGAVTSRRSTRYTLSAALDALDAVTAEEEHRLGAAEGAGAADAAVKARAWSRLRRAASERGVCPRAAPGLRDARAALDAALQATDLPLAAAGEEEPEEEEEEAGVQWASLAAAGAPGAGGDVRTARAALAALAHVRGAPAARLRALLRDQRTEPALVEVARVLGAAGSEAAHEAAAAELQLRAAAAGPAALAYLAAVGAAPHVPPALRRDLLRLADDARDPAVGAAALLAAAAAAADRDEDAAAVRDYAARRLARCKDDACSSAALLALGELARADTADLLLERAARGPGRPALLALHALRRAPPATFDAARLHRLLELADDARRPLELRAAALDLAATRAAHVPLVLTRTARRLLREAGPAAGELRRVLWQRLAALAARHAPVRHFLRSAAADPELGSWHARAHPGTSSVVVREAEWGGGGGGWRGQLDAVTVAAAGLLRDAAVTLRLRGEGGELTPVLGVGLWTTGLRALAGGGADGADGGDGEDAEDVAAGLLLSVAGATLPPITLFSGQAALLAHVWAGTASTDTPALRALLPLPARAARLPLAAAGAAARLSAAGVAALALDARASLSLWARTGAARLRLRAALGGRAAAALAAPWARAAARSEAHADARLRVSADLDFYSAVALCVRVHLDDHEYARDDTARAGGHTRRRSERARRPGRGLALGRANDAVCRTLAASDDDGDDGDGS